MTTENIDSVARQPEFSIKSLIMPLMAVIIGMIMVILDSTVVNVAIPNLQVYFDTSLKSIQWTITAYTLSMAAVIPMAGWLTDKFGAKRVFLTTIALFTVGSVLCAMAQTSGQLVLFRVIQGLGGGMVAPIGMAMIFKLSPAHKRGSVMAMLGVPMLLAPAAGPILSGWLIGLASWHWIFLINLPIGIAAFLVGMKHLPVIEQNKTFALDIYGIILAPIAFSMLAFGMSEGGSDWTSTRTLTGLIVGGVALIVFIIVELRQKHPLLELRVFGSSDFTRGVILNWISQIALIGSILMVPLFLQTLLGYTPLESGLTTLPMALASVVFMPIGGVLFDKVGARPLVFVGLSIITVALFLLSQVSLESTRITMILPLALMGAGMGLSMMAINTHVLNSAPRRLVSRVTPLTTATQQVVMSFAIAGLTGYLTSRTTHYITEAGTNVNLAQSSASAFGDIFFLTACIAAFGVLVSLTLRKPRLKDDHESDEPGEKPDATMMMGH